MTLGGITLRLNTGAPLQRGVAGRVERVLLEEVPHGLCRTVLLRIVGEVVVPHAVDFVIDERKTALAGFVDILGVLATDNSLLGYRVGTSAGHHLVDDRRQE